jgi:predicted short-subunit dehydrogenase-like oxidoreductase (DUF2520 family)
MVRKPRIAIVGPGRFGTALVVGLQQAGYRVVEIVSRDNAASRRKARALARQVDATWKSPGAALEADVIWFCVPDREIASAARHLARATDWKSKIALHSSGALASDELGAVRMRGASVASVHPLMTFVNRSIPSLEGVPFALEGDARAVRLAGGIVRDLGGEAFAISKHSWRRFWSPCW